MSLRVGVIGCGNIFDVYMANSKIFRDIDIVACASQNGASAFEKAEAHRLRALSIQALLEAPDIDIVLILAPSPTHAPLAMAVLEAGKHVYMEKTIARSADEARQLLDLAARRDLRVGVAPDTVLGSAVQAGRELIDSGQLGDIILGTAAAFSHGMEAWHPNPVPFYGRDVGPVMDIGPYLLTTLVTLLGPVQHVTTRGRMGNPERTIGAEGPRKGQRFRPETNTSVLTILEFTSGATVSLLLSWDVWKHGQPTFELHGTRGSLRLPHYNWFGGEVLLSAEGADWQPVATDGRRLGVPNWSARAGMVADYRGVGLADMANAIRKERPHRASGELALHVLDVLLHIGQPSDVEGARRIVTSSFERTEAFAEADVAELF